MTALPAVHPCGPDMRRAANELDAVASATERATSAILSAVEEIEMAAASLREGEADPHGAAAAEIIISRVLTLYEACNFQDIAGQRLKKVMATLRSVETGAERVLPGWDFATPLEKAVRTETTGTGAPRLHGPALPGDQDTVTQAEIDAYFA